MDEIRRYALEYLAALAGGDPAAVREVGVAWAKVDENACAGRAILRVLAEVLTEDQAQSAVGALAFIAPGVIAEALDGLR